MKTHQSPKQRNLLTTLPYERDPLSEVEGLADRWQAKVPAPDFSFEHEFWGPPSWSGLPLSNERNNPVETNREM